MSATKENQCQRQTYTLPITIIRSYLKLPIQISAIESKQGRDTETDTLRVERQS